MSDAKIIAYNKPSPKPLLTQFTDIAPDLSDMITSGLSHWLV